MKKFKPIPQFHGHSHHSLDGAATVEDLVGRAKELEIPALAITEHGNLNSAMELYTAGKKAGVLPVLGIEAYVEDEWSPEEFDKRNVLKKKYLHLTLHFKTQRAYEYFCSLTPQMEARAVVKFGERKPILKLAELEPMVGEITIGSGCMVGCVCKFLMKGDEAGAATMYERLRNLAGPGNFFVEIFPHAVTHNWKSPKIDPATKRFVEPGQFIKNECTPFAPDGDLQKSLNKWLIDTAHKYGDPVVPSLDYHFARPEQKLSQNARLGQGMELWQFYNSYHIKDSDEVGQFFMDSLKVNTKTVESWIDNAHLWASSFKDFKIPTSADRWVMPEFHGDSMEKIYELINKNGKMNWSDPLMVERLKYEIEALKFNGKLDVLPYFFPIADLTEWCRDSNILFQLRGSGSGSLLVYLIGISDFNPMKHGLSFDRFISKGRVASNSLPDLDLDIGDRDRVLKHLTEKYGDKIVHISTDVKAKLKSAIKDAERTLLGSVTKNTEDLCRAIPDPPQGVDEYDYVFGGLDMDGGLIEGVFNTSEALQKYAAQNPKTWSMVKEFLGIMRNKSSHACGFCITDKPAQQYIPLYSIAKGQIVTGFSPDSIQDAGLVKYDFLGLNTLKDIATAFKLVEERHGIKYDRQSIPDDPEIYKEFERGNTATVFQFNTAVVIPFLKRIKPVNIEDLAAITALARPGTLDALAEDGRTLAEVYVARRNGEPATYVHSDLEPVLKDTYGTCIAEKSLVHTRKGMVPIEKVNVGSRVLTHEGRWKKVLKTKFMGVKDTVKVRLTQGRELICTPEHRVLTQNGWKEAGGLTRHDIVKFYWEPSSAPNHLAGRPELKWLLGLLLADGHLSKKGAISIACSSKDHADKVKDTVDKLFPVDCTVFFSLRCWYVRLSTDSGRTASRGYYRNPIRSWLGSLGLPGLGSYTKIIPEGYFDIHTLAGFFDGDGCISNNTIRIKNMPMAEQLYDICTQHKIPARIFHDDRSGVSTISIMDPSILPLRLKTHKVKKKNAVRRYIPIAQLNVPMERSNWARHYLYKKDKSGEKTNRIPLHVAEQVSFSGHSDWSSVISVVPGKRSPVYDLMVEDDHSFIVGGIAVHNCLFQEQQIQIFKDIGGYTSEEAEKVRKGIGKKDAKILGAATRDLKEKCLARGWTEQQAQLLMEQIMAAANYSFNKSHAISYSYTARACMFLKTKYPIEWWTAVLSNADKNELPKFWAHCSHMATLPDINKSGEGWVIDGSRIIAPIGILKGIGEIAYEQLLQMKPFSSIDDYAEKVKASGSRAVHKGVTTKLILSGVMDSLFPENATEEEKLTLYYEAKAKVDGKKPEKVPEEYKNLSEVQKYANKKQIVPIYSQDQRKLVLPKLGGTRDSSESPVWFKEDDEGRPEIFVSTSSFDTMVKAVDKETFINPSARPVGFYISTVSYVVEEKTKSYQGKTKQMTQLMLDTCGDFKEAVLWPSYEGTVAETGFKDKICIVKWKYNVKRREYGIMSIDPINIEDF